MNTQDIISTILRANFASQVFENMDTWQQSYKTYIRLIHPDVCKDNVCKEATAKLNRFKNELENGKEHEDDAGTVVYTATQCTFWGDADLLKTSFDKYRYLMSLKDDASKHFQNYLPRSGTMINNQLTFELPKRAVPLSALGTLEAKHVHWILSRLLEFTGWINQIGYCHAGINPESIYAVPENHGIVCTSFYYLTKLNQKQEGISGRYVNFYPPQLFVEKKASSNIDLELAKKTAIYLLGDKSGSGVILRKTQDEALINFLQKQDYNPLETYKTYRNLLKKYGDKAFYHLHA